MNGKARFTFLENPNFSDPVAHIHSCGLQLIVHTIQPGSIVHLTKVLQHFVPYQHLFLATKYSWGLVKFPSSFEITKSLIFSVKFSK